jgi:hypothetical protein
MKGKERYNFRAYLRTIQRELTAEGYVLEIKVSDQKTVHSAFVRFPGLLYELALSPHRSKVLGRLVGRIWRSNYKTGDDS